MQELFGTFIFTLFVLVQADKPELSNDFALNSLILSGSYITARAMCNGSGVQISSYGACLNPAIALGILFAGWIGNGIASLTYIWLYPVMSILGGFLALLFFEFLFKKT